MAGWAGLQGMEQGGGAMGSCTRRLSRMMHGCSRPLQDVGGVALLAGLLWVAMAWGQQSYTYENLGTFLPSDIADGDIAGSTVFGFPARMVDGTFQLLNHPEATGLGFGINRRGVVVGNSGLTLCCGQAYGAMMWDANGVGTNLPLPATSRPYVSAAYAINARGTMVGGVIFDSPIAPHLALRWRRGQMEILDAGGHPAMAQGVNGFDEVAGQVADQAAVWDARGRLTTLGTLGGTRSSALAINDHRRVVGWADDAGQVRRAFIWDRRGGMRALAGDGCSAVAINAVNVIVGSCGSGQGRAFA